MLNVIDYYEYSKLAAAAYVDLTAFDGASIAAAANTAEKLPQALAEQTFDPSKSGGQPVWIIPPGALTIKGVRDI